MTKIETFSHRQTGRRRYVVVELGTGIKNNTNMTEDESVEVRYGLAHKLASFTIING